jgi:hypothetical protein
MEALNVTPGSSLTLVQGGAKLPPFQQTFVDAVNNQVAKGRKTIDEARAMLDPHGLGHHLAGGDVWEIRAQDQRWMNACAIVEDVAFVIGTRNWPTKSRLFDAIRAGHAEGITGEVYEITWLDERISRHIDVKTAGRIPLKHQDTFRPNALSIRKLTPVETSQYWAARERLAA